MLYLWLFALGTSALLSDSSCSSETSFLLLLRASALRMLARTLWCSRGSMLFTSSNLDEQQTWRYCPAPRHPVLLLVDVRNASHPNFLMHFVKTFFSLVLKCLLTSSWMLPMPSIWARSRARVNWQHKYWTSSRAIDLLIQSIPTMTVAWDASVLGSMMKRMTLMKPSAALTISLVRDDSSRQML